MKTLNAILSRIDGKSYNAYKDLKGKYFYEDFQLNILRIQGDPFASPSLLKVSFDLEDFGYPIDLYNQDDRSLGLADYIHRLAWKNLKNIGQKRGSGKSGTIEIQKPAQQIIKRTALEIEDKKVHLRFYMGLPAQGRRVLGRQAKVMLLEELPEWIRSLQNDDPAKREKAFAHSQNNERAEKIRQLLIQKKLICFIANGSQLARRSSVDHRPMEKGVTFQSPSSLEIELEVMGKRIKGMGLPKGITIITGGGFHGKSTLMNAMEMGVYNHIPGDGRELCICDQDTVKVRAEDGRFIQHADISPFINNLPFQKDTEDFFTENASGSTSQACNIIESLELGAKTLLIDEDTSASNFMIRDHKVQELIKKEKEPITSYIERIKGLKEQMGISSVLVIGGLGDYFAVADTVLMLDEYHVMDITQKAKEVISRYEVAHASHEVKEGFTPRKRQLAINQLKSEFNGRYKIKTRGLDEISINKEEIDIRGLEQLTENAQANLIGEAIKEIAFLFSQKISIKEALDQMEESLKKEPISSILGEKGNLAYARKYELGATLSRWRKGVIQ
ncbi:ABC-ATPase domain-containing protein [Xanthovirga aplysinae]|uniref:ABC-ATPase domain-containing protein n=1 Tax=Xanthovirga aplysinae TaxID=2529853 RepID=UPI0012BBABB1|nr:ABC-ATPase domain-containing protein [Xanthovirga aplysinae]MTI33219.1 hypothetical protein [Xanthovirga aplysinae]